MIAERFGLKLLASPPGHFEAFGHRKFGFKSVNSVSKMQIFFCWAMSTVQLHAVRRAPPIEPSAPVDPAPVRHLAEHGNHLRASRPTIFTPAPTPCIYSAINFVSGHLLIISANCMLLAEMIALGQSSAREDKQNGEPPASSEVRSSSSVATLFVTGDT